MNRNRLVGRNLPVVAILGRPNVGKSTLFNRIAGEQKAVVHNTPGLTRDRNYARGSWLGRDFLLVDTGGYELSTDDPILKHMREQTMMAVDEANVIVFLTDIKEPNNPTDDDVMQILRRTTKPVIVAVNKCDNHLVAAQAEAEFHRFAAGDVIGLSATQSLGTGDLLDAIVGHLPEWEADDEADARGIRVSVVGRPNVGKSTLVNSLLGFERCVASEIAGTTRDAVDTTFERDGQQYTLIDTAGIRRRGKVKIGVEKMTVTTAVLSMERCDLALLVVDAEQGLTEQDAHVAGYAVDSGCGCVIVVNKWDAIEKDHRTADEFAENIRYEWGFLRYVPIIFLSAKTGLRVSKLFDLIQSVYQQYNRQIETPELNRWLKDATTRLSPPTRSGRQLRLKYCTQVATGPPTFVLFVNDPKLVHFSYERYLVNRLRDDFGFEGVGIRLRFKEKSEDRIKPF